MKFSASSAQENKKANKLSTKILKNVDNRLKYSYKLR